MPQSLREQSTPAPGEAGAQSVPRPEVAGTAEEKISQTSHSIRLDGREIKYTATAGTLPIRLDDGTVAARMFFVAYTKDGEDAKTRPVWRTRDFSRRRRITWPIMRTRCWMRPTFLFEDYVENELKWESDLHYPTSGNVQPWSWDDFSNRYMDMTELLRQTMARNPFLKVFVAISFYDMATVMGGAEFNFGHLGYDADVHRPRIVRLLRGGAHDLHPAVGAQGAQAGPREVHSRKRPPATAGKHVAAVASCRLASHHVRVR